MSEIDKKKTFDSYDLTSRPTLTTSDEAQPK